MYVGVYSETRIDKVWFYIIIIAFDVAKRILILSPRISRGYRSVYHAISRFGRHLGLAGTFGLDDGTLYFDLM